ncbi:MAG: ABC transporter ATP-binding protein [Candidatus Riflebacteria bacterium]
MEPIVVANNLSKTYRMGEVEVNALKSVSFEIRSGQFVSFTGPSGSGKTTLLNLIGSLDIQTAGELLVAGQAVNQLSISQRAEFRGRHIGIIFQDFNLIPVLTVYENIEYPLLMIKPTPEDERRKIVVNLMEHVGIAEQANKFPSQISGGQKQRVAIARALATSPKLVLADEPTANLDRDTSYRIIDLMKKLKSELGTSFIFSTHDPRVVKQADVIFTLEDGRIIGSGGEA